MPLLYVNLGGEMMYVVKDRIDVQLAKGSIGKDVADRGLSL